MRIDIFQDTICPWCRIGKQNLFAALETWTKESVDIHWRAFLLDPSTPEGGRPRSSLADKLGGEERVAQIHERVCQIGEACGLAFDFDNIEKLPNTMMSHQLIKITPHELQTQMADALMRAYFEEGRDIGSLDVLLDVATGFGLVRDEMQEKLSSGEGMNEVKEDLQFAQAAGISGVPLFVFNGKYALSGAQPVEAILQALDQAYSDK